MEHATPGPVSDSSAFFQAIAGFAVAALVMLGVGGTVYYLLAPGGLLGRVFDRSVAGGLAAILALLVIGLCMKQAHGLIPVRSRNRYAEFCVYGFASAGVIIALQYLIRGGT